LGERSARIWVSGMLCFLSLRRVNVIRDASPESAGISRRAADRRTGEKATAATGYAASFAEFLPR
jgi:hypothetical protein